MQVFLYYTDSLSIGKAWILLLGYTKQKQPGCKKVQGQSEATMVISDQNL